MVSISKMKNLSSKEEIEEKALSDSEEDYGQFDEMLEEVEHFDNKELSTEYKPTKKERKGVILIIDVEQQLEAKFIMTLVKKTTESFVLPAIEVCLRVQDLIKPVGFMEFSFENMIRLRSYNNEFPISIKDTQEVELTEEMILNLP